MTVTIRDAKGSAADRQWIESAYSDYLEDLSHLNTGVFPVYGEFGDREPDLMARWFADDKSHPLIVLQSAKPVGFALVVRVTHQPPGQPPIDYHMSEFFVTRKSRKLGIGRDAAVLMFNRFAGEWEVTEYLRNPGAVQFWRRVIAAYTRGQYMERVLNGEVRQRFRTYNNPLQRPRS